MKVVDSAWLKVLVLLIVVTSAIQDKAHRKLDETLTPVPTLAPPSETASSSKSNGNGRVWWRRWRDHMRPSRTFKKDGRHKRSGWRLILWIFIWFFAATSFCCLFCTLVARCQSLRSPGSCGADSCCDSGESYCSLCLESECDFGSCYACSDCCAWTSDRLYDMRNCCADCCLMSTVCILGACCCRRDVIVKVADNSQQADQRQIKINKRQDIDEFDNEHQHGFAVRRNDKPASPPPPPPTVIHEPIPYAYVGNHWSSRLPYQHQNPGGTTTPYYPDYHHYSQSPSPSPYHHQSSRHLTLQRQIPTHQELQSVGSPYAIPHSPPPHARSPQRILDDADFIGHNFVDNYGPQLPPPAVANQRRINASTLSRNILGSPLPPPVYPPAARRNYSARPLGPSSPFGSGGGQPPSRLLF